MPKEYIEGIRRMAGGRQELPSRWLETMNPRLAAQQAAQLAHAQHTAPQTEQAQAQQPEAAPQPPKAASTTRAGSSTPRRQHATAAAATAPAPSSYAGVR
jgi:hypothetical protein